jgi:membrane associated rhomboid family serine protease
MFADRDYNRPRPAARFALPPLSMTALLISVTAVVFLAQLAFPGSRDVLGQANPSPVEEWLWLTAEPVRHGQVWRLLTYIFLHGGFWHILLNMWGLFMFGRSLEQRLGRWRFLALYLVSGLIGAGTWLLLNWGSPVPVIGASGSVCGVVMATAMLFPDVRVILLIPPVPLKLKTFIVVFAVVEIFSELAIHDGIAHIAHLGGMLGGFFFMQHHLPRYSFGRLFGRIPNPFRRKWRLHTNPAASAGRGAASGGADSADGGDTMHDVDRVLDKIGREGINSLTAAERDVLERARERLRQR